MENPKKEFCPECGIGINNSERQLGFCQNCKAHWDPNALAEDWEGDEIMEGCEED